jgi:hypothetical protein
VSTATKVKGFPNTCPSCDEPNGLVVDLDDVSQIRCVQCSGEFTADRLRLMAAQIAVILDWLETAPEREEQPG